MEEAQLETMYCLHQVERKNYIIFNYVQFLGANERERLESRRSAICSWMYRFADSCDLCRDLVSRAMSYFDRFVMAILIQRNDLFDPIQVDNSPFLQLSALIALNLAIKIHGTLRLDLKDIINVSRGNFDLTKLIDMERHMLCVLSWRLNFPTSAEFALRLGFLMFTEVDRSLKNHFDDIMDTAIYFTELAVWDSYFLEYKASTLAIACLSNAIESLGIARDKTRSFLSALALILDSLDMIPHRECLYLVRSRVQDVCSARNEH